MNILVIAAHPDDEILGCGATILKHSSKGDIVKVVIMATGLTSRGDASAENLLELKESASKASNLLGVSEMVFCDKKDNMMDSEPILYIVKDIENIIIKFEPDIIYTHFYSDLNIDHQLISEAVQIAARPMPGKKFIEIRLFEVLSSTEWGRNIGKSNFNPNLYIDVSSEMHKKIEALEIYKSEMRNSPHPRSYRIVRSLAEVRGSECGMESAEAFFILRSKG